MDFPKAFLDILYDHPYLEDAPALVQALAGEPVLSVRENLAKKPNLFSGKSVPWCPHGYYLDERPSFTLDPMFHSGRYYVQEASSMVIYYLLDQLFCEDKTDLKILDLCASPGGKSTTILDFLAGQGMLVANEVIQSRVKTLVENIMKWGHNNAVVTNNDANAFGNLEGYFDCIVVDAPCSGEGMFRKNKEAHKEWSQDAVEVCELRQRRILHEVIPALSEEGYIIYSTCTFNTKENIENVASISKEYGLTTIFMPDLETFGAVKAEKDGCVGYHFFPHLTLGEGFFVAVMKNQREVKPHSQRINKKTLSPLTKVESHAIADWSHERQDQMKIHSSGDVYHYNHCLFDEIDLILQYLNVRYSGVKMGTIQKNLFLPNHAAALAIKGLEKSQTYALNKEMSLAYLSRTLNELPLDAPRGWLLITYEGWGLGWVKNLGNRINNYFPQEWRIRMDIKNNEQKH